MHAYWMHVNVILCCKKGLHSFITREGCGFCISCSRIVLEKWVEWVELGGM